MSFAPLGLCWPCSGVGVVNTLAVQQYLEPPVSAAVGPTPGLGHSDPLCCGNICSGLRGAGEQMGAVVGRMYMMCSQPVLTTA